MLLKDYRLEIFNSKCQPGAMGVHCHAHFGQDVACALPYLNAVQGGFEYVNDPEAENTFSLNRKFVAGLPGNLP